MKDHGQQIHLALALALGILTLLVASTKLSLLAEELVDVPLDASIENLESSDEVSTETTLSDAIDPEATETLVDPRSLNTSLRSSQMRVNVVLYSREPELPSPLTRVGDWFSLDEDITALEVHSEALSNGVYRHSFYYMDRALAINSPYQPEFYDFRTQAGRVQNDEADNIFVNICLAALRTNNFIFESDDPDWQAPERATRLALEEAYQGKMSLRLEAYEADADGQYHYFESDDVDFDGNLLPSPTLKFKLGQTIFAQTLTTVEVDASGLTHLRLTAPVESEVFVAVAKELKIPPTNEIEILVNGNPKTVRLDASTLVDENDSERRYRLKVMSVPGTTPELASSPKEIKLAGQAYQYRGRYNAEEKTLHIEARSRDLYFSVLALHGLVNIEKLNDYQVPGVELELRCESDGSVLRSVAVGDRLKVSFVELSENYQVSIVSGPEKYYLGDTHRLSVGPSWSATLDGLGPNGSIASINLDNPSVNGKTPFKIYLAPKPTVSKTVQAENTWQAEREVEDGETVRFRLRCNIPSHVNYEVNFANFLNANSLNHRVNLVDEIPSQLEVIPNSLQTIWPADAAAEDTANQASYDPANKEIRLSYTPAVSRSSIELVNGAFKTDRSLGEIKTVDVVFDAIVHTDEAL
ncbi:MAG: hypothetical protein Q4P72_01980, partial [Eubacteriales bacterium]|nr:hypothetical protein [Eubacteriales bacterium]